MNHEVCSFKFTCDGCGEVVFVRDVVSFQRPPGWGLILEHDDKSYRTYNSDLCATCLKKHEEHE